MKSIELKRWLAEQEATFRPAKGSHVRVFLDGKRSILPMHSREVPTGTYHAILRQLGLKKEESR